MKGTTLTASEVRLYLHNLTAITADAIVTKPDKQTPGKPACVIEILMTYRYFPQKKMTASEREVNPFGFIVTSYQRFKEKSDE